MNNVKSEMIDIYKLGKYDWMNYKINEEDVITFHHIIKVEDGGEYIKENGALLTERTHEYLHYIERVDKKIYQLINKVFLDINEQMSPPNMAQRNMIELLLMKFEIKNADRIINRKENVYPKRKRIVLATKRRKLSQETI